jgi:plastocyanin
MKRLTITLGLLALAATLAACSGTTAAPGSQTPGTPRPSAPAGSPGGNAVTIVAKGMTFTQPAVTVKAGAAFDLVFDNQDGAPHNVAVSDASGTSIYKGEIVSSKTVTYPIPALGAGSYAFICEVHPDMKGTITAQ